MHIERHTVGIMGVNCYIVHTDDGSFMVDPGDETAVRLAPHDLKAILLTHGHFDHIAGADALRQATGVPLYVHKGDAPLLESSVLNLSSLMDCRLITIAPPDKYLSEGDKFMGFSVFHTPGHSPGGISLYHPEEKVVFCGDTLFCEGYGRYDFGDFSALTKSLLRLLALPEDTVAYPGHGKPTTIHHERIFNPIGYEMR